MSAPAAPCLPCPSLSVLQPEQLSHQNGNSNAYCKYNDQVLQLFTSSLFLAGAFAALVGMVTCKKFGRRFTMVAGGLSFIIGRFVWGGFLVLAPQLQPLAGFLDTVLGPSADGRASPIQTVLEKNSCVKADYLSDYLGRW